MKISTCHVSQALLLVLLFFITPFLFAQLDTQKDKTARRINKKIVVSENGRFLQYEDGEPFFWLGDTGWLLFEKLTREEAKKYLENRKEKAFTVIQCIIVHALPLANVYGDSAFENIDISRPLITPGNNYDSLRQYDFWDHVEYIIDEAAKNNIHIALVSLWGSVTKQSEITVGQATIFAKWLAKRFGSKPNIFWINGGDIRGDVHTEIWNAMGRTLKANDPNHLMTYHPFGRTQSSTWFHNESWLDFNMFQSGHRRYDQRKDDTLESWKGEDNWRYVREDFARIPAKPTLDGEPSYENIPQGLHDTTEPYWTAADCRRYGYWSVFAGACGHTYGNNAVMQMYKPGDKNRAYGVRKYWYEAIEDSGASQMQYLANLILSRPYFERVYDSSLVIDQGEKYNFIAVTRGESYLFAYTYTGRMFTLRMGKISGTHVRALWYNPRNGTVQVIGTINNSGTMRFLPPGVQQDGNDWILVLDDSSKEFSNFGCDK